MVIMIIIMMPLARRRPGTRTQTVRIGDWHVGSQAGRRGCGIGTRRSRHRRRGGRRRVTNRLVTAHKNKS